MKSYTDLEQSKMLAEILPLESADMYYHPYPNDEDWYDIPNFGKADLKFNQLPCWSLAILIELLPKRYNNDSVYIPLVGRYYEDNKFICGYFGDGLLDWTFGENPVDACVEMILKLHEQKISDYGSTTL